MGSKEFGIDLDMAGRVADEVAEAVSGGVQVALVIGGGNIFRGVSGAASGMDRANADQMGMLATAVSAAPFLGLLGTVWGVMDAFSGMAESGSVALSAVAPGISGALLTTIVGLFVALPSMVGYNLLSGRIRRISVQMDNFAQEFISEVHNTYVIEA